MYQAIAVIVSVLVHMQKCRGATNEHTNVADLQALCDLMNLAKGTYATPDTTEINQETLNEIEIINISVADPKWRSALATEPKTKKKNSDDCKPPANKEICKPYYERWEDHNIALAADKAGEKYPKIENSKLKTTLGRSTSIMISGLAERAAAIREQYNSEAAQHKGATSADVITQLTLAAAGPEAQRASTTACTITLTSNRADDCTLPKGTSAVCETLLCICALDSTKDKSLCGTVASPDGTNQAWGESNKNAKWTAINSVCSAQTLQTITPDLIRQRLQAALSRIKHHKDASGEHLVIGTAHTGGVCSSQSGKGCVNPKTMTYQTAATVTGSVSWATAIEAAAAAAQKDADLAKSKVGAMAAISAITREARQLASALNLSNKGESLLEESTKTSIARTSKPDCAAITQPDQCRSRGECEWDDKATGTDKKCKLNTTAASEQKTPAAETAGEQ
uniref:Variant surface glycoprotein 1232 n=1 Tax=Trypanosoma brucei TaxID=5691 RepID=M4SVV8_9TRYP|nr:variant surface glycoprotein 1232 [Trypanosoma brucei]